MKEPTLDELYKAKETVEAVRKHIAEQPEVVQYYAIAELLRRLRDRKRELNAPA